MTLMTSAFIFAWLLTALTFAVAWLLSSRSHNDREKTSPFECGFDPKNTSRIPFSLRFFLLGIIFIVFDIEIVLIMPIPLIPNGLHYTSAYMSALIFLLILLIGLLHEWREGSLNWSS
nr:NADH dehydrogenase subunit 3 [Tubifex tubifex]